MGDMRNKIRKDEETERIRAMQSRLETKPKAEPTRCQCGLTHHQVEVMWAVQADRWSPLRFYCPACLPDELRDIVEARLTGVIS